ncbi:MAG: tail fiber domain-containing protein [Bacteroidota bacterium]
MVLQNSVRFILIAFVFCAFLPTTLAQVAINTTGGAPDTSAMLDVSSSDKGILIPRMDSTSRTAILQPADGLMVYDTTTTTFWYYDEEQWNEIRNGSDKLSPADLLGILDSSSGPGFFCLETINSFNVGTNEENVTIADGYAYVSTDNDFFVVDVSVPSNPISVGALQLNNAGKAAISGNYAFVASGSGPVRELVVIDISNPSNMIEVDRVGGFRNAALSVIIEGDYAYVIDRDELYVFDISDPIDIVATGSTTLTVPAQAGDLALLGDYVYVISNTLLLSDPGLLEVFDVSNPSINPVRVGNLPLGAPTAIAVSENFAYVISDGNEDDLKVIDVSNPTAPSLMGSLAIGNDADAVVVWNDYVLTLSNDLKIIDVSAPNNPLLVNNINVGAIFSISDLDVSGNFAYVLGVDLRTIRLTCPEQVFSIDPFSNEIISTPVDELVNDNVNINFTPLQLNGFTLNATTSQLALNSNQSNPSVNLSSIRKFGNVDAGVESTDQSTSNQAGNGFTTTPWVYTNAIEAQGERGSLSTLITIGNDGSYGTDDEIHLVTDGESRMVVNADGRVGIGRNPTTRTLEVDGTASKATAGDWLANSDARLKKNIQQLNAETILEKLLSLKGITYEWDDDKTEYERPAGIQYGFTAQNIQEVFPTLVEEDAEGYLQTAYGTYDAMYVEALRALLARIENQQQLIETLQQKTTAISAENQQLQQQVARIQEVEATPATLQQQLSSIEHSTTKEK